MAKVLGAISIVLLWSISSATMAGEETVRLTDLDIVEPSVEVPSSRRGRAIEDTGVLMFGFGIILRPSGVRPDGVSITFRLNRWFTDFSASFGIAKDNQCHGGESITFQLLADEIRLVAAMRIRDEKGFSFRNLNVSGVTTLTIQAKSDSHGTDCVAGVVESPKVWR